MCERLQRVDALRGAAVLGMVAYHALWFAADADLIAWDRHTWPWRVYQKGVAGVFFMLVGVGVSLRGSGGASGLSARDLRLAAAAMLVTLASLVLDPGRPVWFGALHCVWVCSLLVRPWARAPIPVVLVGSVVAVMAGMIDSAWFDGWAWWTGLGTRTPPTFDVQPLFPSFGVALAGTLVGRLRWTAGSAPGPLCWVGRHSLALYLVHVPILLVLVQILRAHAAA